MTIQVGETIPSGEFPYVPYDPSLEDPIVCGLPAKLSTDAWKGKKIVLFGVPGAFTRTCSANHLPPFVAKADEFKAKGVDKVYCIASNDMFVMSGWGRLNKTGDKVDMLSDPTLTWIRKVGLVKDLSAVGFGERVARFAMIINDLKVEAIEVEANAGEVTNSGADYILSKL